jgi:hypothetical protein
MEAGEPARIDWPMEKLQEGVKTMPEERFYRSCIEV